MVIASPGTAQPVRQPRYPETLLEEIHLARDDERRRLSAEIHDGVVQWMVGALYRLSACRQLLPESACRELADEMESIATTLKESVRELRRVIADLRPPALGELGLVGAIQQSAGRLKEQGIACRVDVHGEPPALTPAEERALYGVVHEALVNIRRHSNASRASVSLHFHAGIVSAEIEDNGRGFNPAEAMDPRARPGHIGLLAMKDRAEILGAALNINSAPGRGTVVSLAFTPSSYRHLAEVPRE